MKMTRIYSDSTGESHFEDVEIQFEEVIGKKAIKFSRPFNATGMSFTSFNGILEENWHTAPRKQAIIILSGGEVELAVSDGSKRRFGPGQVLLLEDTSGKGHTTSSVDGGKRDEIWVALE